jgi:hypothetical protein
VQSHAELIADWAPSGFRMVLLSRPDLDIDLGFVNNVYALPEALIVLENGALGRG